MPEESFETPQPVTESRPTNWPRIILAAVLGLALLAGAAYAGYWYGTESAKPPASQASVSQPTPSVTDTTVNWETYKNEEYRFTLKYPDDYTLKEEEVDGDVMLFLKFWFDVNRSPFRLVVLSNKNTLGLKEFYEDLEKDNLSGDPISPFGQAEPLIRKLQSGETIYFFKGVYCVVTCDKAVWARKDKVYEFVNSYYNIPQQDLTFNQILSTFKFLD